MTDVLTVNTPLSLSYPEEEEETSPEPSAELQQMRGSTRVKRFTAKEHVVLA